MTDPGLRYHVGDGGTVGLCPAPVKCRIGGPGSHHPSDLDARRAFERDRARAHAAQVAHSPGVQVCSDEVVRRVTEMRGASLPSGGYFIADPWNIIGRVDQVGWNAYVDAVEESFGWENDLDDPRQEQRPVVAARYAGQLLVSVKSFHGSGLHWSVEPPRRVPSDTGLISALPRPTLEALGIDVQSAADAGLGFYHSFTSDFVVSRGSNGIVHLGNSATIVHDDTIPQVARDTLHAGDAAGAVYEVDLARQELRRSTYDRVVNEFLAIDVR